MKTYPEEWDQTQNINIKGTFLTVKYAIPHLRENGGDSIVIVSSVNGNRIFSSLGFTAYSCSKAVQIAFAKMAAAEFAQWNIRVNVVCPGLIHTSIVENTSFCDENLVEGGTCIFPQLMSGMVRFWL